MKLTAADLCRAAGVGWRTYQYNLTGRYAPRAATLAKLQAALNRFHLGFGGEAGQLAPHAACKAAVVLAAFYLKQDPRAALSASIDPTGSTAAWRQTAPARRLGMWIANGQLGFRTSDVARAFGVTKQAVSAALRDVEDDDGLDAIKREIEGVFS